MPEIGVLGGVTFAMASSLVLLVFALIGGRRGRLDARLDELAGRPAEQSPEDLMRKLATTTLPRMGQPLVPKDEAGRTRLQTRLIHAGIYSRQAIPVFLGVKMTLMVAPVVVGLLAAFSGTVTFQVGMFVGAMFGTLGMIAPSFWLDNRKTARQATFRRALPDALDMMVICLEGGASLPSALRRVGGELATAHPALARELQIVQREIQLGLSPGDAIRSFADRCDLEELRSLASVILQSERFGASLVKSMRVHAESLRIKRIIRAEEMANKAVVKILFPTVFFILPAMFIVILGPTSAEMMETWSNMAAKR